MGNDCLLSLSACDRVMEFDVLQNAEKRRGMWKEERALQEEF